MVRMGDCGSPGAGSIPARGPLGIIEYAERLARRRYPNEAWSGGVPHEDLVQSGLVQLLERAERYDSSRAGYKTFATPWLKKGMSKAIMNRADPVRLSEHARTRAARAKRESDRLFTMGYPEASREVLREARSKGYVDEQPESLFYGEASEERFSRPPTQLQDVYRREVREALGEVMGRLTPYQRELLERCADGESYVDIARSHNVSRMAVRQLHRKLQTRMQRALRHRGIRQAL